MKVNITVVGVPEDGCVSLSSKAVNVVSQARVVAGHPRHFDWFPQCKGQFLDMSHHFSSWLTQVIEESSEGGVVVLASGDPLFFGIGSTLLKHLPKEDVAFIPTQSSPQLAFSRLGIPWNNARYFSLHGRELTGVVSQMQSGDLYVLLTDHNNTPQKIASHFALFNQVHWKLSVCEQLGGIAEHIASFSVEELANSQREFDPLNIIVAQRLDDSRWGGHGQFASDDSFQKRLPKNGLITKESIRNLVIAQLKVRANDVVWDIGSGSGSIAIEAAKIACEGKVYAVECNVDCFESVDANCRSHSTDNVKLIKQKAPAGLSDLPSPDSVFIGGSRGQMKSILELCWHRLQSSGRIVASAVTFDTVNEIYQWLKDNDVSFDVQLINISHLQPLAHYHRYQAENPIHLFCLTKKQHKLSIDAEELREMGVVS
ncbi:precorrin-6y C5,15-methyltransferase (decarboxylating) subunit CbiE [Vibrio sp. 10N.222.51.C12]|uniref:precorrin-6y C5,15-methyltransferase (decarboxylating) subunit CbiE n=1 Tax=unclassified Vibrio TaxID=2614977 RepID=UPI000C816B83|nr:precorrin-6y C5,15-methyltransferase (decarboxylating) subunit CbiE [Vibrio sp. 10N.286.48.B7]PMH77702.1 precorrin-6Y-methylase [Vibrio sp. 10N.286.48.B7]